MRTHKQIFRLILLLTLAGLVPAPALAQTDSVYVGLTTQLAVIEVPGDAYIWELYNDVTGIDFSATPGNCPAEEAFFTGGINTGTTVNVTWLKAGTYFFKVTAIRAGCTNNLKVGKITVLEALPNAILALNPVEICVGEVSSLSITFTGTEPWNFKLQTTDSNGSVIQDYSGISSANNPYLIRVAPLVTTSYTVIEVADRYSIQPDPSNTAILTVNPLPVSSPIYVKTLLPYTPSVPPFPYVIERICEGSIRTYRINGEQNSTYSWV